MTKEEVHQVMMEIPESWRYRWCGGGWCGCMGCTNVSGASMTNKPITKEQWDEWVASNPEPDSTESIAWCNDWRTPTLYERLADFKARRQSEADLEVARDVLLNRIPADDREEI